MRCRKAEALWRYIKRDRLDADASRSASLATRGSRRGRRPCCGASCPSACCTAPPPKSIACATPSASGACWLSAASSSSATSFGGGETAPPPLCPVDHPSAARSPAHCPAGRPIRSRFGDDWTRRRREPRHAPPAAKRRSDSRLSHAVARGSPCAAMNLPSHAGAHALSETRACGRQRRGKTCWVCRGSEVRGRAAECGADAWGDVRVSPSSRRPLSLASRAPREAASGHCSGRGRRASKGRGST